jgi:hypothetical protein
MNNNSTSNELFSVAVFSDGPGKTSPRERVMVGKGDSVTVLFLPESGCMVRTAIVDGMPTGDYNRDLNSYTFKNVAENHTIRVEFTEPSGNV